MAISFSSDHVNHDIEKAQQLAAFKKKWSGKKMAAILNSKTKDARLKYKGACKDEAAALEPVYDTRLLKQSADGMMLGAILLLIGFVLAMTIGIAQPISLIMIMQQLVTAAFIVSGLVLLHLNYQSRTKEHLPKAMTEADVQLAHVLLNMILQADRRFPSPAMQRTVLLSLYIDTVLLLGLVIPILMNTSIPLVHIATTIIGAIVVGRLMRYLIEFIGEDIQKFRIQRLRNRLILRETDEADIHALAIQRTFDSVMQAKWSSVARLLNMSFVCHCFLLSLIVVTLALLRVILGEGNVYDLVLFFVAGFVVVLSSVVAIRQQADAETLSTQVAMAHRIAARFPDEKSFTDYCASWKNDLNKFIDESFDTAEHKIDHYHDIKPADVVRPLIDVTPASFKPSTSRISTSGFGTKSAPLPGSATPPKSSSGFTGKTTGFKPKIK